MTTVSGGASTTISDSGSLPEAPFSDLPFTPDAIAGLVHAQYTKLPKTGKPQPSEWTVLAGVVLCRGDDSNPSLEVVALGTGTKCLTATQIASDTAGECVHDGHAEVCARRALRAYLLSELKLAAHGISDLIRWTASSDGFELVPGCRWIFYSSEPPCGDAAIFDDDIDADGASNATDEPASKRPRPADTPASSFTHRTGARPADPKAMEAEAATGGAVCALGLVRTKPGRGVRTSCMSCSDKLARWHALGAQGALLSLLLAQPLRFDAIVVGAPASLHALRRAISRGACVRAGDGEAAAESAASLPRMATSTLRFAHALAAAAPSDLAAATAANSVSSSAAPTITVAPHPCSNSLVWAACRDVNNAAAPLCEALNGLSGRRLGANKKQPSPKHRSLVCKALVLAQFRDVVAELASASRDTACVPSALSDVANMAQYSYDALKARADAYQTRKTTLIGPGGPMSDWVRAPAACEAFGATSNSDTR